MSEKEWIAIAQKKVRETIKKTDKTIQKVDDCLSNLSKNPHLEPAELDRRLTALKDGYASNEIEGNPLTQEEKDHLESMVKKGLGDNEMLNEIKKSMGLL